jgi:diacylglycerol O-acyltransferase
VPIGGARRCVGRSWPLERVRYVQKATGSTVNDVVLAMSAGALRGYLSERNALPDKPLIAMVPVSLRQAGDDCDAGGNHLGAVLCSLATDVADPIQRLQVIGESMRHGKDLYRALSDRQAIALRRRWQATTPPSPEKAAAVIRGVMRLFSTAPRPTKAAQDAHRWYVPPATRQR